MADMDKLFDAATIAMWAPVYAFIAWAAWYRFRMTPAGLLLGISYAIHAVFVAFIAMDHLGGLGGITGSPFTRQYAFVTSVIFQHLLMSIEVVGLALIPLSLRRLRMRVSNGEAMVS